MFIDYTDKVFKKHREEDDALLKKCCKELQEEMKKLDIKIMTLKELKRKDYEKR